MPTGNSSRLRARPRDANAGGSDVRRRAAEAADIENSAYHDAPEGRHFVVGGFGTRGIRNQGSGIRDQGSGIRD